MLAAPAGGHFCVALGAQQPIHRFRRAIISTHACTHAFSLHECKSNCKRYPLEDQASGVMYLNLMAASLGVGHWNVSDYCSERLTNVQIDASASRIADATTGALSPPSAATMPESAEPMAAAPIPAKRVTDVIRPIMPSGVAL
jgi:hypothetical protein